MRKNEILSGRKFSIVFFGDHGLAHIHREDGSVIINNNMQSKFHYDIPLVLLDSDIKHHKVIKTKKSGLQFTAGLADWMRISGEGVMSYSLFDGVSDINDYGLEEKINAIENKPDPAIDMTPYIVN